ncbi:MAG: lipoate--protein ligase [Prevotella sp.]
MKYIALPDDKTRILPFYLAMEEFVAYNIDEEDCFFMWQVEPTVIFGRNQLIENEVNLDYCRSHHIQTYRRKSGGGCVYADMSNIMFSYVTRNEQVCYTFGRYIMMITDMLRRMGVDASTTGRNDIIIDGRKVSGNAFYHVPGRSIVHGTMLYDTNMENMVGSITPSDAKLLSKGVSSVRQHIALLKDYTVMTIGEFKRFARETLCADTITLTEADVREIERMTEEYLTPEFIYGNNPKYTVTRRRRYEGVGDFEVRMELKNNIIKDIDIKGDYFLVGDIGSGIVAPLRGVELSRDAIAHVLNTHHASSVIHNMTDDMLVDLLAGEN